MLGIVFLLAEAFLVASSLSLDAFAAGFAYGSKNVKIPIKSVQIINIICSAITLAALLAGAVIAPFLSVRTARIIAFGILFVIGVFKLLERAEKSDVDELKSISSVEAAVLAFSLSIDGAAVGIGAALANVSVWAVFLFSLVTNTAMLSIGNITGKKAAKSVPFNMARISGVILIGIAVSKLF